MSTKANGSAGAMVAVQEAVRGLPGVVVELEQPSRSRSEHLLNHFTGLARRDVGDRLRGEEELGLLRVEPVGVVGVPGEGEDRGVLGEQLVRVGADEEVEPVAGHEQGGSGGDGVGANDT